MANEQRTEPPALRRIASGIPSVDPPQVRRGALFLVNIGVPLLTGAILGQSQAALAGTIVGLAFGFADNAEALPGRLRLLGLDAGCIAAGGVVGYLVRGNAAALWTVFVVITFGVGVAARSGREPLLAGRHAAMAFTVAAAIPSFSTLELWYLLGAVVIAAVSRTVDYLIAGRLPRQPAAPLQPPSGRGGWLRFACAFAGAATAALWIGRTLAPIHTIWVVTTTIVVMQPDAGASYRRMVERVAGTFAGVFAAWIITMGFHSEVVICVAIVVVVPFIPHHLANRYWLHTALIALMVLLSYDLAGINTRGIGNLLSERVIDMLLGCAMALVGTAAAFPRAAIAEIEGLVEDRARDQRSAPDRRPLPGGDDRSG